MDKIVTIIFRSTITSNTSYYFDINVSYADPVSAEIVENVGKVDIAKYNYCEISPVYTMDIPNNKWYQLMYRNPNYEPCNQYNQSKILYGDLLTINVSTAQLLNVVTVCVLSSIN